MAHAEGQHQLELTVGSVSGWPAPLSPGCAWTVPGSAVAQRVVDPGAVDAGAPETNGAGARGSAAHAPGVFWLRAP